MSLLTTGAGPGMGKGGGWVPPATLLGFNRLAGMAGRTRPALVGSPAVNVRGTVATAPGRLGPCASFGGSAALAVGMYPSFDPPRAAGDWTMTLDFYMTALPSVGGAAVLLSAWRLDTYTQFRFVVYGGSGPIYYPAFEFVLAGGGQRVVQIYPPAANVATDTWYTFCVRYASATSGYTLDWNGQTSSAVLNASSGNPDTTGPIRYDAAGANTNAVVLGGLWNPNDGWTSTLSGRLENLSFYSRRLSDAEVTTVSAGYDPSDPPAETQIILSEPQALQVHQKDVTGATDDAPFRISGALRGAAQTFTDLEYEFNNQAWADLGATVDNTARTFEGTVTVSPTSDTPAGRQGTLNLRLKNNTAVTATIPNVGIGYVFAPWGQSNSTGAYTDPQPYSVTNGLKGSFQRADGKILELDETLYHGTGWGYDNWAWGSTESAGVGSLWPRFAALWATRKGFPVMIVNSAIAGASINATVSGLQGWAPAAGMGRSRLLNGYAALLARVQYLSGGVILMPGLEGETDAFASMPAATFEGHFETLADALAAALTVPAKLMNCLLYTGIAGMAAINTGTTDAAGDTPNCEVGGDFSAKVPNSGVHYTTDLLAAELATILDARVAALGY